MKKLLYKNIYSLQPFIDKPFQEELNILEKDILFFTNKCDKIEAEIKAPGNKKDYLVLQKM